MGPGFDELKLDGITIRGITQGGVETCLMVPELGLAFDVGRCPPGLLRYNHIFATHGHADHLGGLFYLLSQRGLMNLGPPDVYAPADIVGRLEAILELWSQIEGFPLAVRFHGCVADEAHQVGRGLSVTPLAGVHRVSSFGYLVTRATQRLRPEFAGRDGAELAELRRAGEQITSTHETPLLCISGDTQIEFFLEHAQARRCQVLVHEVTSWDERRGIEPTRKWGHTHIDELIAHVEKFEGSALVLVHRSPRHSKRQAEEVVAARFPRSVRDRVHVFGS